MRLVLFILVATALTCDRAAFAADQRDEPLDANFGEKTLPFLTQYCVDCHGAESPEADLNLAAYTTSAHAAADSIHWSVILEKLESRQMPPPDAPDLPSDEARQAAIEWFRAARDREVRRHAGDPGIVLARRLSNAEYNYTVRDLTGVDIRPASEFPVDPANTAGFDNSGESLSMSPSLLKKYLQAAQHVAHHLVLKPHGFEFAPHPMLAETDRDKYCVQRIISFYFAQDVELANYFEAAWRYKHRAARGEPAATFADIAEDAGGLKMSAKYLETVCGALEGNDEIGPLAKLQAMWRGIPDPTTEGPRGVRKGCESMRDYVVQLRKKVEPRFLNIKAGSIGTSAQPVLIWKNVQYATHRMTFDPAQLQVIGEDRSETDEEPEPGAEDSLGPGRTRLVKNEPGDPDLLVPAGQRDLYETAFAKFCRIFPDRFYMEERGRNYFDVTKDRGRYLSAGFHSRMGYFRDDQPLYELILDDDQQTQLDAMWRELDFVASASERTYVQFYGSGQRGERGAHQTEEGEVSNAEITSEQRIKQLENTYYAKAENGDPRVIDAIKYYFSTINDNIRWMEKVRREAEPSHLEILVKFAERAHRRPFLVEDKADVLEYYHACRAAGLDHEGAMREGIVSILMSPEVCYRIDLATPTEGVHALSDYELASRLSYFLWSSMPDEQLFARAAAGDLHEPEVIAAEVRRMLQDDRVRALAAEFGGSWLDFRRFDEIATVDRDRFPAFSDELRSAMYEEPIRYLVDAFQSNRSVLDLICGNYTFVNPVLAKHYGAEHPGGDEWVRLDDAAKYGRGGLLPMAAFMTKNAPGLRTSPVKRGNWVVKNVLGEKIPAPPPNVPELPQDEAELDLPLREMLVRHREDPSCAACHARFDSFGLVFEGFGPVGERREQDLAGRAIDASATFPDGAEGQGLDGLREYIREHRQQEFTDNMTRKLVAYALGRSLMLSDELLVRQIDDKLKRDEYRLSTLVESIVTSPQFLNKRGQGATEKR